jgi:choline dehydrogenase-like flavoprotein
VTGPADPGSLVDAIVVGSGPSGVHAAQAALARGATISLVDVGHEDGTYAALTPDRPFSEIRAGDPDQHRYFLGLQEEGLRPVAGEVGGHLTPIRLRALGDVARWLPFESADFSPLQSLAVGGLGVAWGAGCAVYEAPELERVGLDPAEMRDHYAAAAAEVGVSGDPGDDTAPHLAGDLALQPPLDLDSQGESLLAAYRRRRDGLRRRGFRLGRYPVAVLTRAQDGRQPNPYHDMDFWSDARESVWRPRYTLRKLERDPRFRYLSGTLALRFETPRPGQVRLLVHDVARGERRWLEGRSLLLAAGALNSARLVLRSFRAYDRRVPILCNPYSYLAAVNLRLLGRPIRDRRHSLVQLCAILRPAATPEEMVVASLYSYRSLLLFRLARTIPLPPRPAMLAARTLVTSLVVAGIFHPDAPAESRTLGLRRGRDAEGIDDTLDARFPESAGERRARRGHERRLARILARLGCVPVRILRPMAGASIHYAGTLPRADGDRPLTCDGRGRLRGAPGVYVADGASWRWLPGKALTLSLMANARRVALGALEDLAR